MGTTEGDDTHFVIRKAENITVNTDTQAGLVLPFKSGDLYLHADLVFDEAYLNSGLGNRIVTHELGHIVGLNDIDKVSNAYSMDISIMSTKYGAITSPDREASTPMIYDIATAQYLYGANDTFESGSSTYDGADFTGASKAWTLWDAGGTADHFDLSAVSAASNGITLDLRGGVDEEGDVRFSAINKERVAIALDPDEDWEIAIEIEHATGHDGDDVLIGNDAANILHGAEGMDSLLGGFGDDELYGDDGHDLIADTWWTGFDAWEATDNSNDLLSGGDGDDELVSYDGSDVLFGGAGNDAFYLFSASLAYGNDDSDTFSSMGNNTLIGGAGEDYFNVYSGYASIEGGAGDNSISVNPDVYVDVIGGTGVIYIGGVNFSTHEELSQLVEDSNIYYFGYDWYLFNGGSYADIYQAGASGITMRIHGWENGDYGLFVYEGVDETFPGVIGDMPTYSVYGDLPNDTLYYGNYTRSVDIEGFSQEAVKQRTGTAIKQGSAGNDSLSDSSGDQYYEGLAGDDTILGGSGHNILDGGEGSDSLTGGDGEDIFRFSNISHSQWNVSPDQIIDFSIGEDVIDISALGLTGLDSDGGSTEAGELRILYNAITGNTGIVSDQNGFGITLMGNLASFLTQADFIFATA